MRPCTDVSPNDLKIGEKCAVPGKVTMEMKNRDTLAIELEGGRRFNTFHPKVETRMQTELEYGVMCRSAIVNATHLCNTGVDVDVVKEELSRWCPMEHVDIETVRPSVTNAPFLLAGLTVVQHEGHDRCHIRFGGP